ncbi:MAG: AarF/ABC1/UbiB kinase family protein [Deltaproteobacteria bacterium]|nr:AarF/ABC1/UbiB kinase family protein [Deltaproteobacteria bacterium]
MKVLSTATNVAQAFKNVGRVTEILRVLAKHGFIDLLHRMNLSTFLGNKETANPSYAELPVPERLRLSFEELGPTFIKLGQLLATRSDLIPDAYVEEFSKLQDRVTTLSFEEIHSFIKQDLKVPFDEVFASFDEIPNAAASIAQVHFAVLKTGEKVAVKVQRPVIEKIIQNDISVLRGLAVLLEKYIPEVQIFNPIGLVEEFFQTIVFELDFRVESNNIRKIKANLKDLPKITIPIVYEQYSTSRILILERFEGIRFSDKAAILKAGIDPKSIIEIGADAFFHMVMQDGLFHGDLHPGNLFVLSNGTIGIIDFGIVGRLGKRVKDSIITIFIAIIDEDYESLASEYLVLCAPSQETDLNILTKDLMDTMSPYIGMSLGEVNAGKVLLRSTSIAAQHHLKVPRELMLLFRSIMTIDGLGKKLDPGFDVLQLGNKLAKQVLSSRYSKERLTHDLIILGRDLQDTLESFPRLLKRFLRVWSYNHFAFELKSKELLALTEAVLSFNYFFYTAIASLTTIGVGVALLFLDKGPVLAGFSVYGLLVLSSGFWLLGRGLWTIKKP